MKKSITKHFIFLFTLIFASCSNLFTPQESLPSNTKIHFTGTLCITGAVPESLNQVQGDSHAELDSASQSSSSRSALPSITPGLDYYYYVTATQTDGSGTFNINSINDSGSFNTSSDVTFALELTTGKWDIECGIKKAANSGVVSENDVPVMSDTYPATISAVAPVLNHTFYPKPSQSGEGKVELKIRVNTEIPDFGQVTASCSKSAWAEKVSGPVYDDGQWIIQTSNTLPSGTYEVAFNFYNTNNILLYSTVQTINVFDNMLTNTWVSDGSGAIDGDGTFALSNNLVTSFSRTTFYVGQTAAATSVEVNASDTTGNGSPYAPLETITKAASIIAATGNGSKDYRIYVSGTLERTQEIPDTLTTGKAKSITIQGYNGLDANGIDGNNEGSSLTIDISVPVTIKNLKITGGSGTAGGGIYVKSGSVTLSEGALITGNNADYGGGIYVESAATALIAGGEISANTANTYGGGIYNDGDVFVYGNSNFKNNSCTVSMKYGGAVYNLGNLYLGYSSASNKSEWKGEISGNSASSAGAIWSGAGAKVCFDSGTIKENSANWNGQNQSLFIMGTGVFEMGGSAYIASTDPVYLCAFGADRIISPVTITSALAKKSATDPVTITCSVWNWGTKVVKADGNNFNNVAPYKDCFTLTDQSWECKVSSDNQYLVLDAPIYVAGQTNHPYCGVAGNDTNGDGTKAKPFATIAKAIELLTDKDTDYTIYIDGEVTGSQTIPDTLKKDETGTYKAQSLTIEGVNGINSNHEPIATLDGGFSSINTGRVLTIETDVPVKIKTLTIKNGYLNEESDDRDGGGIYISSSSTVTLGDEGSVNGDYTNTVLLTNNYGVSGNAIYSEGVLTLCNCTFKNNQSSSSTPGDNSPAIEFNKNDLILAGGNIHFSSNTPGDIYIGAKTSNGSTGSSTPCKIQINVALPDDFSASLCAFRNAWAYDRLRSKQILDGLSSEYSKFSLYGITDTANTYAINSSGEITQTAN